MSDTLNRFAGPCQFCMDGREKAQLVLHEGAWHPWPLVCALPDAAPTLLCDICPGCDRDRFNAEEVPRLNEKIAALKRRANPPDGGT